MVKALWGAAHHAGGCSQCAALSRCIVAWSSNESNRREGTWNGYLAAGRANSAVVVEAENVVAFGLSVFISIGLRRQIRESGFHSVRVQQIFTSDVLRELIYTYRAE